MFSPFLLALNEFHFIGIMTMPILRLLATWVFIGASAPNDTKNILCIERSDHYAIAT